MVKKLLLAFLCLVSFSTAKAQLKAPGEFMPHQPGEAFTPHHLLINYLQHVADNSNLAQLVRYGYTNEHRPLVLAYVSTPENLARLGAIRENNLRRAGMIPGSPDPDLDVAIVWLSFSVHGNEPAGSESAPSVLYDLVNPANAQTKEWLKNTVVIIDPSLNPDGYSRYTHWYNGVANTPLNPDPRTTEHQEPWPGGRVNHYLFDLNRDWAWQTQVESRSRIAMYLRWFPHIHADLHEQGYTSPYYFAPAAQPYHPYLTKWQRDFQVEIGKNHARYFDANGWLYFTKEVFDLLYPSYGDTYPMFSGSIGMTYEQGGGGRGGRAILLPNGDTLTLKDRIMHHKTTALSTVEIASKNAERLLAQFGTYFENARTAPTGNYKTYVFSGDNPPGKLSAFIELLERNGIKYGKAKESVSLKGFDYQSGQNTTLKTNANDLVISAYQPRGLLAQVLLDPSAELVDSLTYDITAWSLPYAYGLKAFASTQQTQVTEGYDFPAYKTALSVTEPPYAYLVPHRSMNDVRFAAALVRAGINLRYASSAFTLEGRSYEAGTLVITRADNRQNDAFAKDIQAAVATHQPEIYTAKTGMVDEGQDLGSRAMVPIENPKVAVLSGEGTSSNGFGQVWYFFEQDLQYPISIFPAEELSDVDLSAYNILILPEGRYRFDDPTMKQLGNWIREGGRLIAIGYALRSLEDQEGFKLLGKRGNGEQTPEKAAMDEALTSYADQRRERISESISGAIFELKMDKTHPLAFGLSDQYFSLKTNTLHYAPSPDVWSVGAIGDKPLISGFVGAEAKEQLKNTVVFAVEDQGRGSVVYMVDNPLFRGFWENGKLLFSNAVFFR